MNILEPQSEATMPNVQHILISLLAIALIYAGWIFFNQNQKTEESLNTTQQTEEENNADYADIVVVEDFNGEKTSENSTDASITNDTSDSQITISNETYQENKTENTENETTSEEKKETKPENIGKGIYIEVLKTTWVEVKDENKLYLSKVLQPGEFYKVPEGEGKILSVGKQDGVNVYINGVLTNVVLPQKKMNISLDKYISPAL